MLEAVVQCPVLPIRPGETAQGQLLVLMAWLTMSRELYRILGVLFLVIRVWAGCLLFMHRTESSGTQICK